MWFILGTLLKFGCDLQQQNMVIYQVSNLYQAYEAQWVFKDIVNTL